MANPALGIRKNSNDAKCESGPTKTRVGGEVSQTAVEIEPESQSKNVSDSTTPVNKLNPYSQHYQPTTHPYAFYFQKDKKNK